MTILESVIQGLRTAEAVKSQRAQRQIMQDLQPLRMRLMESKADLSETLARTTEERAPMITEGLELDNQSKDLGMQIKSLELSKLQMNIEDHEAMREVNKQIALLNGQKNVIDLEQSIALAPLKRLEGELKVQANMVELFQGMEDAPINTARLQADLEEKQNKLNVARETRIGRFAKKALDAYDAGEKETGDAIVKGTLNLDPESVSKDELMGMVAKIDDSEETDQFIEMEKLRLRQEELNQGSRRLDIQQQGEDRKADKLAQDQIEYADSINTMLQSQLKYAKKFGEKRATTDAEKYETAGPTIRIADNSLELLNRIKNHPGRKGAVGTSAMFNPLAFGAGSDERDFVVLLDQLRGQQFLDAYSMLAGSGQISNTEGEKATAAMGNMTRFQSEKQFMENLDVVIKSAENARESAQGVIHRVENQGVGDKLIQSIGQGADRPSSNTPSRVRIYTIEGGFQDAPGG